MGNMQNRKMQFYKMANEAFGDLNYFFHVKSAIFGVHICSSVSTF